MAARELTPISPPDDSDHAPRGNRSAGRITSPRAVHRSDLIGFRHARATTRQRRLAAERQLPPTLSAASNTGTTVLLRVGRGHRPPRPESAAPPASLTETIAAETDRRDTRDSQAAIRVPALADAVTDRRHGPRGRRYRSGARRGRDPAQRWRRRGIFRLVEDRLRRPDHPGGYVPLGDAARTVLLSEENVERAVRRRLSTQWLQIPGLRQGPWSVATGVSDPCCASSQAAAQLWTTLLCATVSLDLPGVRS
jgi:hypothetical protein